MATSGPAVSKSAKSWEEFEKINSELRNNFESLKSATKAVEEIYKDYCGKYSEYPPSRSTTSQQLPTEFKKMVDELKGELEKALSRDVTIAFVGRTNSGKSSLINSLLRVQRLPVDNISTTMCTFKVRPTPSKEWSVIELNRGEDLLNKGNQEEVDKLLTLFTDDEYIEKRKELNITSKSVIQVNWPRDLCNLPENIVLIDTPGMKESNDRDQVVIDFCKKADIIVAVMDLTSPSLEEITDMVNKMKPQLTLGVFTKWDEALKKKDEKVRQNARDKHEKDFLKMMKRESRVYFVDARHIIEKEVEETVMVREGTKDFLRFERELAERAKTVKALKGVAFIEEAEYFASKSTRALETFEGTIDETKSYLPVVRHQSPIQEEIRTLESERNSLYSLREEVPRLDDLVYSHLSNEKIDQLIQRICNTIKDCSSGKEEDEAFIDFLEKVDSGINQFLNDESEKVNEKYSKWRDRASSKSLKKSLESYVTERLPCTEDYGYNENVDPHSYLRSNTFWAVVAGCGVAVAGTVAIAPTAAAATTAALNAAETVAATNSLGKVVGGIGLGATVAMSQVAEIFGGISPGTFVRRMFGASPQKIRKIKEYIKKVLITFREKYAGCKGSPRREIDEISKTISETIAKKETKSSQILTEELTLLEEWSKKLTEYKEHLQKVRRELDQRKHKWTEKDTVPSDDGTENQSPVQSVDRKL